jgi:beta-lactam-binding protein with PASTA domain
MNTSGSGNRQQVQVPNVTGVELVAATSQLGQLGLVAVPDMSGLDEHGGPWKVGKQEPPAGQWADPGSPVILKALSPTV